MPVIAPFRGVVARRGAAPPRDRTPALYRYEVSFGPPDDRRHATGFLARVALDGFDALAAPSSGNPETEEGTLPVLRYSDERGWVDEILSSNAFDEVVRLTDPEGTEHRVWRVDRPEGVQEVVAQFEDRGLRLESGGGVLRFAADTWRRSKAATDASVVVLLAPEGPGPAPWDPTLVTGVQDEPRPRPWQELAGDPGKPSWRKLPL